MKVTVVHNQECNTVVTDYGDKINKPSVVEHMTKEVELNTLVDIEAGDCVVTKEVTAVVKDHMYYGSGTFDRVSYEVHTKTSLSVSCTTEGYEEACIVLEDLVGLGNMGFLECAVAAHKSNIRENIYPHLWSK